MIVQGLRHLGLSVQAHQQGGLGELHLRFREGVSEGVVEPSGDFTRQLNVRYLVLSDGHSIRLVQDDVGGLEHGIADQAVIDGLLGLVHLPHLFP